MGLCSDRIAFVSILLSLVFLGGCVTNTVIKAEPRSSAPDFRQVVQSAKDSVFPALIYVKVLSETYESGKKVTQEASGSGVIITADGQALTNWHVVDKAREVRCQLSDGRAMHAEIIGTDQDTDLALLQLKMDDKNEKLPFAELGDSEKLREGDFVMAMGAPWGLQRSVSIGIISCTDRYLPENSEYSLWLQSDASISPGNSGGPLVNTAGQVIGINSRGIMRGGDNAFAVPSHTVSRVVNRLRVFKDVNWTYLGLQLQPLKDFEREIYFDADTGVIVSETDRQSPARRIGIQTRDRIVSVNGQAVTATRFEDLPAVRRLLGLLPKEEPVVLGIVRGDKEIEFTVTPRAKGQVEGDDLDCPRWDMTVKEINQFDNPELHFHRSEGVFIYAVKYPGNANNSGFAEQDIIVNIDGQEVVTLDDVKKIHAEAIKNIKKNHKLVFSMLRNGLLVQQVLDFSRDFEKE